MRAIHHKNLIKLKEIVKEKEEANLVFELLEQNLLDFY